MVGILYNRIFPQVTKVHFNIPDDFLGKQTVRINGLTAFTYLTGNLWVAYEHKNCFDLMN